MTVLSKTFPGGRMTFHLDNAKLKRSLKRKERTTLARVGAFARSAIRRSMKKGPKKRSTYKNHLASDAPPRYYTRILKDNIFFVYDDKNGEVTIGPVKKTSQYVIPRKHKTVAALIEKGGTATINATRRSPAVTARYKSHPFVLPAQPIAVKKLKELLRTVPLR